MEKAKIPFQIFIRPELFDHLIYPIGVKLDDEKIITIFRRLHVSSEIDYKISLKEWIKVASDIGLTKTEANILFQTYKIFEGENSEFSNALNSRYEQTTNKNNADVRCFGLFFALQSFSQRTKISLNIEKGEKSPSYFASPLSSPRGKNTNNFRFAQQGLEYQFLINFIKSNLKLFLKVIASDIHNTETTLNENEFNTLKFLFSIGDSSYLSMNNDKTKKMSLSGYLHCYDNMNPITKLNMNIIHEVIISSLSSKFPENSDYDKIKGLSKVVTIKSGAECQNKHLLISSCDDSYIYINTNVITCKISYCTNCTIIIAAASKIVSIDKCEKCQICLISNLTRISNTIDTNIFMYSLNEPILFGDNRGLKLGPHNVTYNDLFTHIKESKLIITQSGIKNFMNPISLTNMKEQFTIVQPEDFTNIVVPFEAKDKFGFKLTPKNYVEVIENRYKNYLKIQQIIKDANFQENQEKAFHVALQGYFRDWLVNSGNYKPINDLVKMIDEPFGIGPLNSK